MTATAAMTPPALVSLALALVVALPLLGALLAVVAGRRGGAVALATLGATGAALAVVVFSVARDGAPVLMALGGWAPPLGIVLRADGLAGAFLCMSWLVLGGVMLQGLHRFGPSSDPPAETRAGFAFWPLVLLLWGALNAIFLSRDLFNLYVGLELLSLAAIALVAIERKPETIAAALRYMVFALMGSLLYLLGAALLYAAHGTLDTVLLAARTPAGLPDHMAAALITAGLAVKTALFPFHAWLPPAHAGAPAPASALLSGLVPKASFFILVQVWFGALPDMTDPAMPLVLASLGAVAVFYGGIMALRQERLKQIIAYSTVAQLGYLFLIFPLAGGDSAAQPWAAGAWTGAMFHALSHALAKASMFLCAGLWITAAGHDRLNGLRGMAKATPIAAFAFGLSAIVLMGLPPSGAFTAKYLMLTAAFASGQVIWAAVLVLGGLLAAIYLYRPLVLTFARDMPEGLTAITRAAQLVPLVLAAAAILLGLASAAPFEFLQIGRPEAAAEGLE
ncbi:complex I subunit 5 family protein [Alkalilacustris brevis]|uniref:complex I subunit 5 family protein n=1 Tax=Alkalilacustris brevis TaxID=2026338 RepID=UPI000E0D3E9C|nr:proton-conducting transporter membrane subunit [Alkalilacustris brevis]